MNSPADPILTTWAAGSIEHALIHFPGELPDSLLPALQAARDWASGAGSAEAADQASLDAFLEARGLTEHGYRTLATLLRAASHAAASSADAELARLAVDQLNEAVALVSAGCERDFNTGTELRWQWESLPEPHRTQHFPTEPGVPDPASCAI